MGKKIAFFVGQLAHEYQKQIIAGVTQAAEQFGYYVDIFGNFGTFGDNFLHAEGEKNILNLPCLEMYDAIIVTPDTHDIQGMYETLSEKIKKETTCPVVSLRCEDTNFYNVLIDDQRSMEDLVEHLIVEHDMKHICFMTGRMELVDAQRRLQGYYNIMNRYNLTVTEQMIFEGNYWRNKGEEAVDWFLSGDEYPDAIVCSNDFMAISVCDALINRGIRIPEDICVTGFDHIDEARYYEPSITGIQVQGEVMGYTAVQMIDNVLNARPQERNEYVPAKLCRGRSCGCEHSENVSNIRGLYKERNYLDSAIMESAYMNVDMENCNAIDELLRVAFIYAGRFTYNALYVCMCDRVRTEEEELSELENYSEQMVIKAIMRNNREYIECDEKFERREILPEKYREANCRIFCFPLHYKNQCLGYIVMDTDNSESIKQYFITWLLAFSNYLDRVKVYSENKSLLHFRQQSLLDELTGLNNRREYERILQRQYEKAKEEKSGFFIISCDMDGLKMINDTYGHLEGDKAIKAFADILKRAERPGFYSARVGGDEFNICYSTIHKGDVLAVQEDINRMLAEYNQKMKAPYELSASMGFAYCSSKASLISCMKKADESMYQEKVSKKNSRSFQDRQENNV